MTALLKPNPSPCPHADLESDGFTPPFYRCRCCGAWGALWQFEQGIPFPREIDGETRFEDVRGAP